MRFSSRHNYKKKRRNEILFFRIENEKTTCLCSSVAGAGGTTGTVLERMFSCATSVENLNCFSLKQVESISLMDGLISLPKAEGAACGAQATADSLLFNKC